MDNNEFSIRKDSEYYENGTSVEQFTIYQSHYKVLEDLSRKELLSLRDLINSATRIKEKEVTQ